MHIFLQSSCSLRQQLMQEVEGRLREEKIKALLKERYSIFSDQYHYKFDFLRSIL